MLDNAVDSTQEVMLKWTDLVISQTSDVWTVSLTFFVACVLVLAGLHGQKPDQSASRETPTRRGAHLIAMALLYLSAASSAVSLLFAYMTKGALISMQEKAIETGKWQLAKNAELDSLLQFSFFAGGFLLFTIAFVAFRNLIGTAIITVFRGE